MATITKEKSKFRPITIKLTSQEEVSDLLLDLHLAESIMVNVNRPGTLRKKLTGISLMICKALDI